MDENKGSGLDDVFKKLKEQKTEYPQQQLSITRDGYLTHVKEIRMAKLRYALRLIAIALFIFACIILATFFFYLVFTRALYVAIYGIFWVITHGA